MHVHTVVADVSFVLRNGPQLFKSLFHSTPSARTKLDQAHQFVVVGGGAGGLAVGSWIRRKFGENSVAIIEPADVRTHIQWNPYIAATLE